MARFRSFLALGADVVGIATGVGAVVAAVVGFYLFAKSHLPQPWVSLLFLGIVLIAASAAGRLWYHLTSSKPDAGNQPPTNGPGQPAAPPPFTGPYSPGTTRLRVELAENLQIIRQFYAEFESIAGPRPPTPGPEDAVTLDLLQIASQRLADIPLRRHEILAIIYVLREAIEDVDALPFSGIDAMDIKSREGERRSDVQVWYLPLTTAKAYGEGVLRSDESLSTLTELHKRLMALRREVWRRYHPPTAPASTP